MNQTQTQFLGLGLGFVFSLFAGFHMHQRLDRDSHIYMNWGNIHEEGKSQFEVCDGRWDCETWGYPYDCDSIMHYPKDQMSKNDKDTIGNKYYDRAEVIILSTSCFCDLPQLFFSHFSVSKNSDKCKLLSFNEWQMHEPYLSSRDIDLIQYQYGKFCKLD